MTFSLLPQPLLVLNLHPDPQGPDGQAQLGEGEDAVLILVIQQEQLLIVSYLQRAQVVLTLKTMQKTCCSFFLISTHQVNVYHKLHPVRPPTPPLHFLHSLHTFPTLRMILR